MTEAQKRYLNAIKLAGGHKVYNGRARKPLKALEAAGLIKVDWDLEPRSDGRHTWRLTARTTDLAYVRPDPTLGTLPRGAPR